MRGKDSQSNECEGHEEEVREPVAASPEVSEVVCVRLGTEAAVDGAKRDNANYTDDYNYGALRGTSALARI